MSSQKFLLLVQNESSRWILKELGKIKKVSENLYNPKLHYETNSDRLKLLNVCNGISVVLK